MGTQLFLASITEVKGDKKNLRLRNKLKQLDLTDWVTFQFVNLKLRETYTTSVTLKSENP